MQLLYPLFALAAIGLLAGCTTQPKVPYAEFVRSVDFTHFDSVRVTVDSSDDLQSVLSDDARAGVIDATFAAIVDTLQGKDFSLVEDPTETVDLLISATWRELQSEPVAQSAPIRDSHQDDPHWPVEESLASTRQGFLLLIEVADARSGNVFWRAVSSRSQSLLAPDAARAAKLAAQLMENFPRRVEKDPNLPHISMP